MSSTPSQPSAPGSATPAKPAAPAAPAPATKPAAVIVILDAHPVRDAYQRLIPALTKAGYPCKIVKTGPEAVAAMQDVGVGILLFGVKDRDMLGGLLNGMIALRPLVQKKLVRVAGYVDLPTPKLPEILMQRGASEIFPKSMAIRALLLKVERWLGLIIKSAEQVKRREADQAAKKTKTKGGKAEVSGAGKSGPGKVNWVGALPIQLDYWTAQRKKDFKKVRGIWMCLLIGPPPSQGKWQPRQGGDVAASTESDWVWMPREGESAFAPPAGTWWIYFGKKPEFDWKSGKWQMLGAQPRLVYHDPKAGDANRIYTKNNELWVSENSPSGLNFLKTIQGCMENDKKIAKATGQTGDINYHGGGDSDGADWTKQGILLGTDKDVEASAEEEADESFIDGFEMGGPSLAAGGKDPSKWKRSLIPTDGDDNLGDIAEAPEGESLSNDDLPITDDPDAVQPIAVDTLTDEEIEIMTENMRMRIVVKLGDQPEIDAELVDFFEDDLIVRVSGQPPASGPAAVQITAALGEGKTQLLLSGNITTVEDAGVTDLFNITLKCPKLPESADSLTQIIQERQNNVSNFMKLAKGG
jgi:hypothetical protein